MDSSPILLVVFTWCCIYCKSSVISISVHVAPTIESEPTDITSISLYWNKHKILCQVIPLSYNKWYHCNTSTFTSYQTNCQQSQHRLIITIPINHSLWIDEIEIYDNNNRYHWNKFCSSLTFPYSQPNTNCINYQLPAWTVFCIGNDCNNYNSLNIDLSDTTEAWISQNITQSDTFCRNINQTIAPTLLNTITSPQLGVTLPQVSVASPTQHMNHGVVFETTTIIATISEHISTMNDSQSFNYMNILLPALLITICVCFLSVVCFLVCKQQRKSRHKKSSHSKRAKKEIQSVCTNSQQILIAKHLNTIHRIVENSSSDCDEFVGSKTNSKIEGKCNDFLHCNAKNGHKVTFDSMAVAQYSLPVSPVQSPHRKPVNNGKLPVIIASDEDSDISESLYLEEKKNEQKELKIELGLKEVAYVKTRDTPGNTPAGDTPVTPSEE